MPTSFKSRFSALIILCAIVLPAFPVQALDTSAKQALLIDTVTGMVLFEKNADDLMEPSSMSKIMTIYMVFERLAEGSLKLDDTLPVSKKAWRKGGSKMFVEVGTRVSIKDLLRGIIVQSGNDAAIVIAEGLAGDEQTFAADMTEKAHELGMVSSNFTNASGWPDEEHRVTARDMALLARLTIENFPRYYGIYSELEFTYNDIRQRNRNPLLYKKMGADGLKTGHTVNAGYGLTGSAIRDGRRLILVINGVESARARAREAERLIEYGFREYSNYPLFDAGEVVGKADVWLGDAATVPLVIEAALVAGLTRKARRKMRVKLIYDGPIAAPIRKGARIAMLTVTAPGAEPLEVPLVAGTAVDKLNPLRRIGAAIGYMLWGAASP